MATQETSKKAAVDNKVDNTEPKVDNTEAKKNQGSVTLSREEYEALISSIKTLESKVDYVSDKARKERWDNTHNVGKSILPVAGVSQIDGKYIVGWRTVSNEAEFRGNVYHENQIIEVAYEDKSVQKMNLVEFYRARKKISGEVIKRTTDENGEEIWTIRLQDGKEIILGKVYVN